MHRARCPDIRQIRFGLRPFGKPGCGFRPSRTSGFGSCPFGAVFRRSMDMRRTRVSPMDGFRTLSAPDGHRPNPGSHGRPRMDESRTRDRAGASGRTKTEPESSGGTGGWTRAEPGIATAPPDGRKPNPESFRRPRKSTARIRGRKRHPNSADSEPGSSGDTSVGRPDTKPIACHIRRRCAFLPKCTDCPRYIDVRCGVSLMLARAGRPPLPRSPTRAARFAINP